MPFTESGYEWYLMCPACVDIRHEHCWGADPNRHVWCCCIAETLMEAEETP